MAISNNDFLGEYELMGYIIEFRYFVDWRKDFTQWTPQWNHKIYKSDEIANQAIKSMGCGLPNQEYRTRPLFSKKLNSEPNDERSVATEDDSKPNDHNTKQ